MSFWRAPLARPLEFELTAPQQRVLAVALLIAPLLILVWILFSALSDQSDHHARLEVLKRDRAIYEDLVAGLPERKLTIEEIGHSGVEDAFFVGATPQDVGRQIDGRVEQMLNREHVTPGEHSLEVKPEQGSATLVVEHVSFSSDIETLTHILYRLSQSKPFLFVDHLAIEDLAGNTDPHLPHVLNVKLLVSGYRRSPS
jgi:hypothetical protein